MVVCRPKSPRTQIRELTKKNAATYYRNAGFGDPTLQHIENYSATVDEEELATAKDKHFLSVMVSNFILHLYAAHPNLRLPIYLSIYLPTLLSTYVDR